MAALAGVDTSACDPRAILRAIALDGSAPHTARVLACKALLAYERAVGDHPAPALDRIAARAVSIMSGTKVRPN
jgi:hypothetical protein